MYWCEWYRGTIKVNLTANSAKMKTKVTLCPYLLYIVFECSSRNSACFHQVLRAWAENRLHSYIHSNFLSHTSQDVWEVEHAGSGCALFYLLYLCSYYSFIRLFPNSWLLSSPSWTCSFLIKVMSCLTYWVYVFLYTFYNTVIINNIINNTQKWKHCSNFGFLCKVVCMHDLLGSAN